jgi:murein DD-endopeptidase MepM/ murein hydrolase activator NlpD
MTNTLIRGAVLWLVAGGLTACASTPGYPIAAGGPSAPPARPSTTPTPAPTTAPAPRADVARPPSADTTTQAAPAPASVSAQPLAPLPPTSEIAPAPRAPEPERPAYHSPTPAEPPRPKPEPVRLVATGKVVEAKGMFRDYTVAKGDHLDLIVRDLGVSRASLIAANHLTKPDSLKPGQHLKAPISKVYVAEAGDSIEAVARRFEISASDLADLNVLPQNHKVRPGEQLALPENYHDRGPVPAPAFAPPSRTYVAGRVWPPKGYTPPAWARGPLVGVGNGSGQAYPSISGPPAPSLNDAQITAAGRGRFVWPVRGVIMETFGVKDVGRRNDGIDVRAPEGSSVHAAADGDVVYAGDQVPGFGNLVLVKHADGWVTAYAHLSKVGVKMRERVTRDQEIGQVGQSGGVSEPQLHFEVRYAPNPMEKAKPIDPLLVLPQ